MYACGLGGLATIMYGWARAVMPETRPIFRRPTVGSLAGQSIYCSLIRFKTGFS